MGAVSSAVMAADKDTGVCVFGNETVDSVVCYGPTVMKQTIVKGDVKVVGTLRAENISARNIQVQGNAELRNSLISQSAKVVGSLSANNVEFKQGVAVESDSVSLNQTKVNGMVTITSPANTPYFQVQCNSVVTGAVLFDGKAGVIQITGDSLVQGRVSNGAMERVKRDCAS
jgi:hypothetical protein